MPTRQPRNLTSDGDDKESPREWRVVGLERALQCTFCGGPSEAILGCPDENAPLVWQIGVCAQCIADTIMTRFAALKHQRTVQLANDMTKAANAIREARKAASRARSQRNAPNRTAAPEVEATQRLVEEEELIARKFDMCPGWSYDEFERDVARLQQERTKR
jgi:hypothetical protein